MSVAVTNPFLNTTKQISIVDSFHPSAQQRQADYLNLEKDVERRLQALVAKDRIRIREFFIDFDKLRKGTVGEAAFRTCIGTLNVKLNKQEIDALVERYRSQQPGLINYSEFCNNVDAVFSEYVDPKAVIENAKSNSIFSDTEKQTLLNLLSAIRETIAFKRILIKPQFQDYDRTRSCHITSEQFRRVLKELEIIPPQEDQFQLLVRKYFDRGNVREVNYFKFCADIDHPQDIFPEYVAKHPEEEKSLYFGTLRDAGNSFFDQTTKDLDVISNRFLQKRVQIANDPSDVERRLQALVVMKRIRIEEFFTDFDKLRRGKVTKNQFESILSILNFNLSKFEFDSLSQKYKTNDPEYMINYKDFSLTINTAFTQYGIQKDPLNRVPPVTLDSTVPARRKTLDFSESEMAQLQEILSEYRKAVQIKRILLKPMFQDFDITKCQHVTKHQFLRTLEVLGVSASQTILNILLKAYMDRGNVDEVNYLDFCQDIDSADDLFGVGRGWNHSFDYYPKTQPRITGVDIKKDQPEDVHDVLAKLRQICKEQRIRIAEFFRDFDKLRSGYITEAQFRIGLNMSKIVLSGAEFRLLADYFKAPKEGAHIRWREFSDSVDEVFTKKGLERSVDIQVGDARTQHFYGQARPSSADQQLVQGFKERFASLVQRQRLDAKSFFQDPDRHNHFKVSPKQFKQTCTLLGVDISDDELEAIIRTYANKQGDIEYLPFLNETFVLKYVINEPFSGAKSTYEAKFTDFRGATALELLMKKIRDIVKRHRIRLGEFFQDHDPLRKGTIDATKFRTTLYAQKIQLTSEEYQLLEDTYRDQIDPIKIRHSDFNKDVEDIFTQRDLEKEPTKTLSNYTAPSILDAKVFLSNQEEEELNSCLSRIGTDVRHRRLLIKPFFQDKDKSNSGFVTVTRFRQILDSQKLLITDREFQLINKRFQAKAANEINYVEFDHILRLYSGDRE